MDARHRRQVYAVCARQTAVAGSVAPRRRGPRRRRGRSEPERSRDRRRGARPARCRFPSRCPDSERGDAAIAPRHDARLASFHRRCRPACLRPAAPASSDRKFAGIGRGIERKFQRRLRRHRLRQGTTWHCLKIQLLVVNRSWSVSVKRFESLCRLIAAQFRSQCPGNAGRDSAPTEKE
jgi:hypothetical protein